jgi:peptide/nickel transport system ATP-binding protein
MRGINDIRNTDILSINDLAVTYTSENDIIHAVNGISLDVKAGSTLGLVGETGAGKTTIAKSIMRILPERSSRIVRGEILFNGADILKKSEREMMKIRGFEVSMIFQDPMTALDPVQKIGKQIAEVVKQHNGISDRAAMDRALEMLEMAGIPVSRALEYPHQFSGGMKQRVVIAIALACRPRLLLADEPTTALDVTIQAQVLRMIEELRREIGTSMILITHDLGIVAQVCDEVSVIYAGEIVESGSKEDIFDRPSHPYTKGLFAALPDINGKTRRLTPIEGLPPDPVKLPPGCCFHPRCPCRDAVCSKEKPAMRGAGPGHFCRCHKTEGAESNAGNA